MTDDTTAVRSARVRPDTSTTDISASLKEKGLRSASRRSRGANSEGGENQTRAGAAGHGQVQRQQAQTWQRGKRPTREREGIEVNTLAMDAATVKVTGQRSEVK